MKKIFFISVSLLTLNAFGQIKSENVKGLKITKQETVSENDTIIPRPLGCVPQRIGRIFNPSPQRQEKNKKF